MDIDGPGIRGLHYCVIPCNVFAHAHVHKIELVAEEMFCSTSALRLALSQVRLSVVMFTKY